MLKKILLSSLLGAVVLSGCTTMTPAPPPAHQPPAPCMGQGMPPAPMHEASRANMMQGVPPTPMSDVPPSPVR